MRTFVVTGSTRGIGRGIAKDLLGMGHSVAISGRGAASVEAAIRELAPYAKDGAKITGAACDVSDGAQLRNLWNVAKAAFGRVDVWVNNAGLSHPRQRIGGLRDEDIRIVEETNLLGMMLATQIALREMTAQGSGIIYNMEGMGSNGMTTRDMVLYGASKYALTYFNKCLIEETKGSPVKICYLSPGIVVTDLLKRDIGSTSAEEWARAKRVYNILGDRVETVTPFLAKGLVENDTAGARVAWLTPGKAARRFLMARWKKREILTDEDLGVTASGAPPR